MNPCGCGVPTSTWRGSRLVDSTHARTPCASRTTSRATRLTLHSTSQHKREHRCGEGYEHAAENVPIGRQQEEPLTVTSGDPLSPASSN